MASHFVKFVLLLSLACLPALGFGQSARENSIVGSWFLDTESLYSLNESELTAELTESEKANLEPLLRESFRKVKVVFDLAAGGTATVSTTTLSEGQATIGKGAGTWSLDGDQLTITISGVPDGPTKTSTGTFDGENLYLDFDMGNLLLKAKYGRQ